LHPVYDLRKLLKGAERGKYAARYKAGTNLVLLDPEVAKIFPHEKAVNDALHLPARSQERGPSQYSDRLLAIKLSKVLQHSKHSAAKSQ
jgi:hypothetical protein